MDDSGCPSCTSLEKGLRIRSVKMLRPETGTTLCTKYSCLIYATLNSAQSIVHKSYQIRHFHHRRPLFTSNKQINGE